MAQQQITLTLPDDMYRRFQQHAASRKHSIEEEVLLLVTSALAADEAEDEIPADIQAAVAALSQLDDAALWQVAHTTKLTPAQAEEIETLLFKQQRVGLSPSEKARLEGLRHEHDKALLVRAQAIGLLQDRGQDVRPFFDQP